MISTFCVITIATICNSTIETSATLSFARLLPTIGFIIIIAILHGKNDLHYTYL